MSFNGHKNWNHWNVSLWLFNDSRFYRMMNGWMLAVTNKDRAARLIKLDLESNGKTHTPDGAPFTKTAIRAALRGL